MPPDTVKFLLVDDQEGNLLALEGLLRRDGLELLKARSGPEALELLLVHDVALVLLDVQMPEMDGFETTAAIREKEKDTGAHVPILAMTAHTMKGDQERCLEAGMDGYITKPIHSKELYMAIEDAVAASLSANNLFTGRQPDPTQISPS